MLVIKTFLSILLLTITQYPNGIHLQFNNNPTQTLKYSAKGEMVLTYNNSQRERMEVAYTFEITPTPEHNSASEGATLAFSCQYSKPYELEMTYSLTRKASGEILAASDLFHPTYQNIPVFPETLVQVNDHWQGEGQRIVDLREYGVQQPFPFHFVTDFHLFRIEGNHAYIAYHFVENYDFKYPIGSRHINRFGPNDSAGRFPVRILGIHSGTIVFDYEKGIVIEQENKQSTIEISKDGTVRDIQSVQHITLSM